MANLQNRISSLYTTGYGQNKKANNLTAENQQKVLALKDKNKFWNYAKMTPFYEDLVANVKYKTNQDMQKFLVYALMKERCSHA